MASRERIENALHAHLTSDEQMDTIEKYYRIFFENPEEYETDYLSDMILETLGLEREEPWGNADNDGVCATNVRMWDALDEMAGVELKHITPDESLAWGYFHHVPFYVRQISPVFGNRIIRTGVDLQYAYLSDIGRNNPEDAILTRVFQAPDGMMCAYCFENTYAVHLRDVEKWVPNGWEYIGDYVIGENPTDGGVDTTLNLWVPFYGMSNGAVLPVMWIDTKDPFTTSGRKEVMREFMDENMITYQVCTKAYQRLKDELPKIDLQSDSEDRYVEIDAPYSVWYNRNHTAYNGNIVSTKALAPWLVSMLVRWGSPANSNISEFICGSRKNWDEAYVSNPNNFGQQNAAESMNIMAEKTGNVIPNIQRGGVVPPVNRGDKPESSGSIISQLLQVATNEYKASEELVNKVQGTRDNVVAVFKPEEADSLDIIFRTYGSMEVSGLSRDNPYEVADYASRVLGFGINDLNSFTSLISEFDRALHTVSPEGSVQGELSYLTIYDTMVETRKAKMS